MENPPFEDVFPNWTWGFSNVVLVFRAVHCMNGSSHRWVAWLLFQSWLYGAPSFQPSSAKHSAAAQQRGCSYFHLWNRWLVDLLLSNIAAPLQDDVTDLRNSECFKENMALLGTNSQAPQKVMSKGGIRMLSVPCSGIFVASEWPGPFTSKVQLRLEHPLMENLSTITIFEANVTTGQGGGSDVWRRNGPFSNSQHVFCFL